MNVKFKPKTKSELRSAIELFCSGSSEYGDINDWDVSLITDMSFMFENCINFNQPLNNWDVSNVTNMLHMFYNCPYMINFKFENKLKITETMEANKNEKCIICHELCNTYYKLCDVKYDNSHFYCKDCISVSKIKKCCICSTKCALIEFVHNN